MWSKLKKFFRILLYSLLVIVFFVILNGIFGKKKQDLAVIPDKIDATNRPFYLGFTTFPPDFTTDGFNQMYDFLGDHSDLVVHHFDAGIPWVEAYENKEFSKDLQDNWSQKKSKSPRDFPVYVAITPLGSNRAKLAAYWGEHDSMELPQEWQNFRLNDGHVKTAYLNYAKRVIKYFDPKYLAIGIESNMLLDADPGQWSDYLDLNRYVYTELKKLYPSLVIFDSIQYEYMRGLSGRKKIQTSQVRELMQNSDILALSTYHYGTKDNNLATVDYFAVAKSIGKPLAIAESGAVSDVIEILGNKAYGSLDDQKQFVAFLLDSAEKNNFQFVVNFVPLDYDALLARLPKDAQEVARAWVHTGFVDTNGNPKPVLSVWDGYLKLPKQ